VPAEHGEMEDLVAAYVLGALDPEEAGRVEAHLEGCAGCREIAARLARVVSVIPLAGEASSPPERLRSRILAAVAAEPNSAPPPARRRFQVAPLPRLQRLPSRVPAWAATALVAAVVAFALGAGIGSRLAHVTSPSTASEFTISGSGELAGAQARVISLKQEGVVFVEFSGLPQLGSTRVYELWIIPAGAAPEPAGVFIPDPDGSKVLVLSRNFKGQVIMAVTREPGPGGSSAPTEQPPMAGNVA
jgi:anti-sigma-K factor RskA